MKVAFVWDWENELSYLLSWKDGFAAMLKVLGTECELKIYTQIPKIKSEMVVPHDYFNIYGYPDWKVMQDKVIEDQPDVVLFWADLTRPAIDELARRFPAAVCFAGGDPLFQGKAHLFKKIFVENEDYLERLSLIGSNVEIAFGTNTELFQPKKQPKVFDALFPACFADWKRHNLYADAVKNMKAMACGWFQDHEPWCYEVCQANNVFTTQHMPSNLLVDFINGSKTIVITSGDNGGSQRSVLEALACNVPVIVMSDSFKTSEYVIKAGFPEFVCEPDPSAIQHKIFELKDSVVNTRKWVVDNYSEHTFARKVLKGLKEICGLN
jgi:glycosyltransferase involved in cell wall biosynthesis